MKTSFYFSSLIILLLSVSAAQAQSTFQLTTLEERTKAIDGYATSSLSINEEVLLDPEFQPGSELTLHAPEGTLESFQVLSVRQFVPEHYSVIARHTDRNDELISFTVNEGAIYGLWHREDSGDIRLGYDQRRKRAFATTRPDQSEEVLACGVEDHVIDEQIFSAYKAKSAAASTSVLSESAIDDSVRIDLMIVYTDKAAFWADTSSQFQDIEDVIAQSMNLSQTALINSQLKIRLNLVNFSRVDYDENPTDENDSGEELGRLRDSSDGFMDEIHQIRNQTGADIVAWFIRTNDTGGLGYLLGSTAGRPDLGFNLNRVQQVASGYTLIHEIGHNMGSAHSRTQSTQAADGGGALFQFSVGRQEFLLSRFHTVMAYSEGLNQAPLFSSPLISFNDVPTGSEDPINPEDNRLSLGLIKRTVSNYRPMTVEPPVADPTVDVIDIEMNREETLSIPFQLSNSGESPLNWDINFEAGSGFKVRPKKNAGLKTMQPVSDAEFIRAPANTFNRSSLSKAKASTEQILYQTSFEQEEGFAKGDYNGINEWRVITSLGSVKISDLDPATGNQHLRLDYVAGGGSQWIVTPFLGYQMLGSYEINFNFSVSDTVNTFDFYVRDSRTDEIKAAMIISDGTIFFADLDEFFSLNFFGGGFTVVPEMDYSVRMVVDPDESQVAYYINEDLITVNDYLGTFTPGIIQMLHRNEVAGTHMDVDDVLIKKSTDPYPWLSVSDGSGVVLENSSSSPSLRFSTVGVAPGQYSTTLVVNTNDPARPKITAPIRLTVADVVSNETEEKPSAITLEQNFPNPFNPSTNIRFTLSEAQNVQLDIYSIDGRKVATLVNENRAQGEHNVRFDASSLSSGVYLYQLTTPSQIITRQMVLIK